MDNKHIIQSNSDEDLFQQLKQVLLKEEREELLQLKNVLSDPEQLSKKVSPIINDHIAFLKQNFPVEFEEVIENMIEQKIKDSQDEIVNLIYPKLDIMIKKYITASFQKLKDNIDAQMNNVKTKFSFGNITRKVKSMFTGVDESDIILGDIDKSKIEEIFIIQRDSGLLVGSASTGVKMNQDVVAGMLTAIKSFVEDAFDRGGENLEMIKYENHKIFLHNVQSYYFAVALSGSLSEQEREELSTELLTFAHKELPFNLKEITTQSFKDISDKLNNYFIKPLKVTMKQNTNVQI